KTMSPLAMCLPPYIVFCSLNANASAPGSLTSALIANILPFFSLQKFPSLLVTPNGLAITRAEERSDEGTAQRWGFIAVLGWHWHSWDGQHTSIGANEVRTYDRGLPPVVGSGSTPTRLNMITAPPRRTMPKKGSSAGS